MRSSRDSNLEWGVEKPTPVGILISGESRSGLSTSCEDRLHLVDALFQPCLRQIPRLLSGIAMLHDRHRGPPITKIIESHQMLAVIRDAGRHSKISWEQPIPLRICKVEHVRDSAVRHDLSEGPPAVHIPAAEIRRGPHSNQGAA